MLSNIFHAGNGIAVAILSPQQSLSPEHCIIPPSTAEKGGDKNMPLPLFQPFFPVLPDKFVFPSFSSSSSSSSDVRWREFAYAERRRGVRRDIIIQTPSSSSSSSFSVCVCMGKEEDEREEGKRRLSKCDPLFFLSFPFPAL